VILGKEQRDRAAAASTTTVVAATNGNQREGYQQGGRAAHAEFLPKQFPHLQQ
jgi:hypothetical protein